MIGHLDEISPWCKFKGNAWSDQHGRGQNGWEELPYWLKGYGDLGYVLKDEAIIRQMRRWLDGMLASQQSDGWFGPRDLKGGIGNPFEVHFKGADMWPMMLALNCLQSYYEQSGNRRVLECLSRYFRFQLSYPDAQLLGCFADVRKGDNLESVYWLYNRTGEPWLLDLAKKIHRCGSDWIAGAVATTASISPKVFASRANMPCKAARNFSKSRSETTRRPWTPTVSFPAAVSPPTRIAPRLCRSAQGFETCSWVEFMHSFEMLAKMSGQPVWADRCEEIAFNSLPAALMPNFKGLHYLTCANLVQLDHRDKSPEIQNGGNQFTYNPWGYRCCQHNVSHGWPYYAEELWLATGDRGPVRFALCGLRSDCQGGRRHGRDSCRNDRLSLRRQRGIAAGDGPERSFSALLADSALVPGGGVADQRPRDAAGRRAAFLCADRAAMGRRRHRLTAAAHDAGRPHLEEKPRFGFRGLRPAHVLAGNRREVVALGRD